MRNNHQQHQRRLTELEARNISKQNAEASELTATSVQHNNAADTDELTQDDDESTQDDEDLDAPPKSQSQSQTLGHTPQQTRQLIRSPSPETPAEPATSPPPVSKPKAKGFRIGGKAKKSPLHSSQNKDAITAEPSRASMPPPSQVEWIEVTPKKPRRTFKIGGKGKTSQDAASSQHGVDASPTTNRFRDTHSPTPKSSPPPMPQEMQNEEMPAEEVHEETPEEKAERKRAELKRRNEELSKKQLQRKKKKRF